MSFEFVEPLARQDGGLSHEFGGRDFYFDQSSCVDPFTFARWVIDLISSGTVV